MTLFREQIARRTASELKGNCIVNLGIGIPTLVAKYVRSESVFFHTENGLLGVEQLRDEAAYDPQRVNAGKLPVDERLGACYFDSAESFGMIRGGHVDVAVLGALQVDGRGHIANWAVPGRNIIGVGGAMDLLNGAKRVIVTTCHTAKNGQLKLIPVCTFPITSLRTADVLITEIAVFKWKTDHWLLTEVMTDGSLASIQQFTAFNYEISPDLVLPGEGDSDA